MKLWPTNIKSWNTHIKVSKITILSEYQISVKDGQTLLRFSRSWISRLRIELWCCLHHRHSGTFCRFCFFTSDNIHLKAYLWPPYIMYTGIYRCISFTFTKISHLTYTIMMANKYHKRNYVVYFAANCLHSHTSIRASCSSIIYMYGHWGEINISMYME